MPNTTPQDLFRGMPQLFRESAKAGMSVSAYMEKQDPSTNYPEHEKTDAFGRVLKHLGIRSRSNPSAGIWASTFDEFDQSDEHRAVGLEWCLRTWRAAKYGASANTRAITSQDELIGSALRPYEDGPLRNRNQFAPEVPLSTLIAVDTPITGTAYRSVFLDDTAFSNANYVRVAELSEIPMAQVKTAQEETRLHKHGRGIEWSYESMREQRLDKVALFIAELALRVEEQKVAYVVNMLINGDGNPGTAAQVVDSTTLDPASTTSLTLRAWLRFKKSFDSPYQARIVLGDEATITSFELMPIGTNEVPLASVGADSAIGTIAPISASEYRTGIRYGSVSGVAANTLLAFDDRFALERVSQIGSRVQESERFITRQSEVMVFTETEGFKLMTPKTNKVLSFVS